MKIRSYWRHWAWLIAAGLLPACASNPNQSGPRSAEQLVNVKPSDVSFGTPEADIMYGILLGEIAAQKEMAEVSAKFYVDAAVKSRDARIASRATRIASFANLSAEAIKSAQIWVEADPESLEAARIYTVLLLRVDRVDEAKTQLRKLLSSDSEPVQRNLLQIGSMLQREASKEGALVISRYLVELYPQYPEGYYVASSLALSAGQKDTALEYIDRAVKTKSDWADAVVLRGRILHELGKTDEALVYLRKYVDTHANDEKTRLTYARMLIDARKLDEARNQFEILAVKMPDNEDVLFTLAMLSLQFKHVAEAEGYLTQLYQLGKTGPQILYYLGQIAEQKNQDEKALEWYARIRGGEYYVDAQLRVSAILARTKSIDDAIEQLHELTPSNADESKRIILFEGGLLKDYKRFEAAFKVYSNGLDKFPKDNDLLFARSLVAERLGKVDLAIKDLQLVVEADPENAAALNALGYTLADRSKSLPKALAYIQKASELEPSDPAIMDSLGWVHYRMGNLTEAERFLRKAIELIKDGEIAAHLGEVLWQSGQKDEALKIWNSAREEFADNETLKQTIERFNK